MDWRADPHALAPALRARLGAGAAVLAEPWPWPRATGLLGPHATEAGADRADPLLVIGADRRAMLLIACAAPAELPPLPAWIPPRACWVQALAVGLVAAHLHRDDRLAAFAAGFLHDAGIPALAARDAAAAAAAADHASAQASTFAAAWTALHPDHPTAPAEAAAARATAWGLPTAADALAPGASGPLPARLRVARALVALRRMRAPADHADPPLLEADLRAAGLDADALADLFIDLAELTTRARRLLPLLRQGG